METMTPGERPPESRLVPMIARWRCQLAAVVVGCVVALAITLPTTDRTRWSGSAGVQAAVAVGIAVLFALYMRRPGVRARLAVRFGAAVPVADPTALWRDREGRRSRLVADAVFLGAGVLVVGLLCGYLWHLPVVVAALPLALLPAELGWARQAARWQREHHVVLWQPPLGAARPGVPLNALFTTPEGVPPAAH
jgi:hypothetical protein